MTEVRVDRAVVGDDDDAELTAWLEPDGAAVEAGQPIAEITASKVVAEVTAPVAGRLRHVVQEGAPVAQDEQIAVIESA